MFGLGYERFRWTPVAIIAAVIFVVFILQSIEAVWLHSNFITSWGSLSIDSLRHGQIWRLFTYAFLHDGFWHMFSNFLGLIFIGLPLQAEIGSRATAIIIALMALAGSLLFTLVHSTMPGVDLLGASAISIGLLSLFCLLYPNRPITLLLFFVLPVTILPKWVFWFTLVVNLFGFFFSEIAPSGISAVGYSAHLGGIIAAVAVWKFLLNPAPATANKKTLSVEPPEWVKKKTVFKGKSATSGNYEVNLNSKAALQQEVDRILDKINTKGFGSLTAQEKKTLDKAKDILGK